MNIKTIEKILKDVVTEWCNDCEAVVKNNNVYSQTTVGEFIIHDKEIDNKYDVYVEEWGDWNSYIVYKGTNTKVSEEDKKEYDNNSTLEKLDTPKIDECYFSVSKCEDGYKISLDGLPSWQYLRYVSDHYSPEFESIFYKAFEKANIEWDWDDEATIAIYK